MTGVAWMGLIAEAGQGTIYIPSQFNSRRMARRRTDLLALVGSLRSESQQNSGVVNGPESLFREEST